MATTDRHGFLLWSAGFTQSDTILNDLLLKLETKLGLSVISRTTDAQPATPAAGDCYIITATATGAQWAGFAANDVTIFRDATWYAFTPIAGWPAWVEDDAEGVIFDGTVWAVTLVANAIVDADFAAAEGFMRKTGAGAYVAHKSNLTAIVAPAVTDDSAAGYSVGSIWLDTVAVIAYTCISAAVGAAVWTTSGLSQAQVDARVVAVASGRQTRTFWMSPHMRVGGMQNPSAEVVIGSGVGNVGVIARSFDATAVEFVEFNWLAPSNFDATWGIAFIPIWSPTATGAGDVVFELRANSLAEGDAINSAPSANANYSIDSSLLTVDDIQYGPESTNNAALGIVQDAMVVFRFLRLATNASDTLATDANIIGCRLIWRTDAPTDA